MPTYRDLLDRIERLRRLLEQPASLRGLSSLPPGEREELLRLGRELAGLLADLAANVAAEDPGATLGNRLGRLFTRLGYLGADLEERRPAPGLADRVRETADVLASMFLPPVKGRRSVPEAPPPGDDDPRRGPSPPGRRWRGAAPESPAEPAPEPAAPREPPAAYSVPSAEPAAPTAPPIARSHRRQDPAEPTASPAARPHRRQDPAAQTAPPASSPRGRPARYANAALFDERQARTLDPRAPIAPGRVFRLRLDIGEMSRESQVERPEPFPEHALPDVDLWLDVMVSSTHFEVGARREALGRARAAHGRFFLPRRGPARAPDGGRSLNFFLQAPGTPRAGARARVGYYFRGALVQSQVLVADVGAGKGGFRIETDFTVSSSPADLGAITERPRVSLFTNHAGGAHQVSVRGQGSGGAAAAAGTSFELDEPTIGDLVGKVRATLRREDVAPTTRRRSRRQLVNDLRALAPLGWQLFTAVPGQFLEVLAEVDPGKDERVLQVARSTASGFTFPWSFIYDFPLDSEIPPEKLAVCPLLERWDGRGPLFEGNPRECPEAAHVEHDENILCPFGFWGLRYSIEQIAASDRPVTTIEVSPSPRMVVAQTLDDVDAKLLAGHVAELGAILAAAFPGSTLAEGKDKKTIRSLLGDDVPLVYFFCHGERVNAADPNTYLGVGRREQITAGDLIGWVRMWRRNGREIWDRVRPLVFINACHSLEINPDTLVSYLAAFVGTARAAGVIGTEVKVHQGLAMELALAFFRHFAEDNWTVDQALRQIRLDFLRDGNLFGLLYTPYCWADLELRRTA